MIKTRYQYTNFIYPFDVGEEKYIKYISSLLTDSHFSLRIFQRERDSELYTYFSNEIKRYFFPTFQCNAKELKELEKTKDMKELSNIPCIIFDYSLEKDFTGKSYEDRIFFKINKIEIICFQTGICFLNFKTYIDEVEDFANVLNFNYKFKKISKITGLHDGIKIQTDIFDNIHDITELIHEITKRKYIENNFFMQGYACIDSENWNEKNDFSNLENLFYKYIYTMRYDSNVEFEKEEEQKAKIISNLKYAKYGISSKTSNLLTSSVEPYNYTKLIEEYNNQYFYTYILEIYKKLYLQKMYREIGSNANNVLKELMKFKEQVLEVEMTKDIFGLEYVQNLEECLETKEIYNKFNMEITTTFRSKVLKKEDKINKWILIALCISMIVNMINFIILMKVGVI